MKKLLYFFIIAACVITFISPASTAASQDLKLNVSGQPAKFEYGTPFIDNGSSLLPLRDLLVALGVQNDDEHIIWNGEEESVTIIKGDKTVKLSVGNKEIYLNGKLHKSLEVPAKNVEGRVYLPARAVAEAIGFYVGFDSESWTILVQEVPFGGGVKADSNGSGATSASNVGIETMNAALKQYADGVSLNDANVKALNENEQAFFSPDRAKLSLDKVAKPTSPGEIAKSPSSFAGSIVNITFMNIDSIQELEAGNGQTVTGAVGHTGGKYREMTEKWEESTYFQIFYLGKNSLAKGDSATVNGVVVGETSIELTNALGVKFTAPMYVMVAGNFLGTAEEYDIRKAQSESNTGKISIPDLDKEVQKKLDRLELTLSTTGLKIFDPYLNGMEVKSVQIEGYIFKPTTKTTIPDSSYDGLVVPLSSFIDDKSQAFSTKNGAFFVKVTTDIGVTVKLVDFQAEKQ